MDHRYSPGFQQHVYGQARWAVKHSGCLTEILWRRPGTHVCKKCGVAPRRVKVDQLDVGGVVVSTTEQRRQKCSAAAYTCTCGLEQSCVCPVVAVNFAARLHDRMRDDGVQTVADADAFVSTLTDDEAMQYGTLRESFLCAQDKHYRSIERVRKAAADEKTSQGGEVVYFVYSEDGKVKIGHSANIEKRFDALQTAASVKLTLALTMPGDSTLETRLHQRFAHLRESGEWFRADNELRHFIEGAAFYKSL